MKPSNYQPAYFTGESLPGNGLTGFRSMSSCFFQHIPVSSFVGMFRFLLPESLPESDFSNPHFFRGPDTENLHDHFPGNRWLPVAYPVFFFHFSSLFLTSSKFSRYRLNFLSIPGSNICFAKHHEQIHVFSRIK